MSDERELVIRDVGAQGDGVAESASAPVFVPFALSGERVIADVDGSRGRLLRVLQPSPDRVDPICRHFGTCGGCVVQHMASDAYRVWKRDLVVSAFAARGLNVNVGDLVEPGGKRRRAVLSAERRDGGVAIGFHEVQSHALVAIAECPVLDPKIVAAIPALSALIAPLLSKLGARLTVTATKSGLDVLIDGIERKLTPDVRSRLASEASALHLARLAVGNDVVVETLPPFLSFASVHVVLSPGCFVQAVAEAEVEMARRKFHRKSDADPALANRT